jgi:hypothetical protein
LTAHIIDGMHPMIVIGTIRFRGLTKKDHWTATHFYDLRSIVPHQEAFHQDCSGFGASRIASLLKCW